MRKVSIKIAEEGDKYFTCPVCDFKVDYVEVESECCAKCIYIWSEVVKRMVKKNEN